MARERVDGIINLRAMLLMCINNNKRSASMLAVIQKEAETIAFEQDAFDAKGEAFRRCCIAIAMRIRTLQNVLISRAISCKQVAERLPLKLVGT